MLNLHIYDAESSFLIYPPSVFFSYMYKEKEDFSHNFPLISVSNRDCAEPSIYWVEGLQKKFKKKNSQVNNYSFIHFFLQPLHSIDVSALCTVPIIFMIFKYVLI